MGSAYVTGDTRSTNFPVTLGAFDTSHNGGRDVFVAKLNPAGGALAYATYLGGNFDDLSYSIVVDGSGSSYVAGYTNSATFPTTLDAFDTSYNGGNGDAFVAKLNPAATADLRHLPGWRRLDIGVAAIDGTGSSYVMGWTRSPNFPTTLGAFDRSYNGEVDAFVAKLAMGAFPPPTETSTPTATATASPTPTKRRRPPNADPHADGDRYYHSNGNRYADCNSGCAPSVSAADAAAVTLASIKLRNQRKSGKRRKSAHAA